MVWVIKTACTQFMRNNTTARCCWPCLLGTTALHSVERNISVEVGSVSVSESSRGLFFYLPSCIKSSRITVLKELWNLFRHLEPLKQLVSASPIRESHTGQRPSWITRSQYTHTHTQEKELGPILFRLLIANLTCHQSILCQQGSPHLTPWQQLQKQ